jgi:hypothetical protein
VYVLGSDIDLDENRIPKVVVLDAATKRVETEILLPSDCDAVSLVYKP